MADKPRSLRPKPPRTLPPPGTRRKPEPNTAPMFEVSPEMATMAVLREQARVQLKGHENVCLVKLDDAMAAKCLRALQSFPRPDKAYIVNLPLDSGDARTFEVIVEPENIFRVILK